MSMRRLPAFTGVMKSTVGGLITIGRRFEVERVLIEAQL